MKALQRVESSARVTRRARARRAARAAPTRRAGTRALSADALCAAAEQPGGLEGVSFNDAMAAVDEVYDFTPTRYISGKGTGAETENPAGTNSGSCKSYAFAKKRGLSEAAALALFCEHYEQVKGDPEGDTHANIRAFMVNGWAGVQFDGEALQEK